MAVRKCEEAELWEEYQELQFQHPNFERAIEYPKEDVIKVDGYQNQYDLLI